MLETLQDLEHMMELLGMILDGETIMLFLDMVSGEAAATGIYILDQIQVDVPGQELVAQHVYMKAQAQIQILTL